MFQISMQVHYVRSFALYMATHNVHNMKYTNLYFNSEETLTNLENHENQNHSCDVSLVTYDDINVTATISEILKYCFTIMIISKYQLI